MIPTPKNYVPFYTETSPPILMFVTNPEHDKASVVRDEQSRGGSVPGVFVRPDLK